MSNAKWCDQGNHAFSANEEGTQTITITQQMRDAYGNFKPVTLAKDICRKCSQAINLLQLPEADEP